MKKKRNKIIGVDFDGTLATIVSPYPNIGEPIQAVIDYILEEQRKRSLPSVNNDTRRYGIRRCVNVV